MTFGLANLSFFIFTKVHIFSLFFSQEDETDDTTDETDTSNENDNKPKATEDVNANETMGSSYSSPIYAVERGDCSFVAKSRNAEEANGKVMIVYNDQQGGVDDIILMD